MKYIYLIVGLIVGTLASLSIGIHSWFEAPDEQGFIYAFQPLIATCGVVIAASLAYFAATHNTRFEKKAKTEFFKNYIKFVIGFDLDRLVQDILVSESSNLTITNSVKKLNTYNEEYFGYEYLSQLQRNQITIALHIQYSLNELYELISVAQNYATEISNMDETAKKAQDEISEIQKMINSAPKDKKYLIIKLEELNNSVNNELCTSKELKIQFVGIRKSISENCKIMVHTIGANF